MSVRIEDYEQRFCQPYADWIYPAIKKWNFKGWILERQDDYLERRRKRISERLSFTIESVSGKNEHRIYCDAGEKYPDSLDGFPAFRSFEHAENRAFQWFLDFYFTAKELKLITEDPTYEMPLLTLWQSYEWNENRWGHQSKTVLGKTFNIRPQKDKFEVLWFGTPITGLYPTMEKAKLAAFYEFLNRISRGKISYKRNFTESYSKNLYSELA